ncbi:Rha family transcriptional regulator [Bartonella tamiae]|uniref:Rha family transcriptional regulator n=1 Tax=Bartonella tamiae TaxID=373638 RepID=UPI00026E77B2|nr:phage regulatory protein/antirepressor Ant [Bartonella tamiae]EJF92657.1 rha family phage regulatory protein [Bartonella tamiae Th307]
MQNLNNETKNYSVPINAERQPIVFIENGEVFANSRDVAAYFGKEHRNIIRDIEKLIAEGVLKFEQTPYIEPQNGQTYKTYNMDRDGFTLLAMGFTGKKALQFKLSYINQFNTMEVELKRQSYVAIDYSDPTILMGVMNHLQIENQKKDVVIAEQDTRLKKLDRLEGAKGSMCITDAAKTLDVKRDHLFALMSARRWIYKRAGNKNWLAYDDKRHAGFMEHDDHPYFDNEGRERIATRALVTAKGLVKLAELLEQPLH